MSKRRLILLIIILALAISAWQLPAILKSIPSRYVAAYLPESMQSLAEREHVDMLPTAEVEVDAYSLINPNASSVNTVAAENSRSVESIEETVQGGQESTDKSEGNAVEEKPGDQSPVIKPTPALVPTPSPAPTLAPLFPTSSRLVSFGHQFQTWNNCGPATLAMGLSFFGLVQNQRQIADILKPNPEDRNVSPWEMSDYVNFETDLSAISRVNGDLDTLKMFIANGYPVIVELGLDPPGEYRWMGWYGHYLLAVAYDENEEQFWVYDSWFGTSEVPVENADSEGRQVSYQELDNYWRQFNRSYIVLFRPEQEDDVRSIIGSENDDEAMWQAALSNVQQELEDEPDNAFLWFNLGTVYGELEDYENSTLAFDQARALGLPWRMLWYQFGPYESYLQAGRYDDVIVLADVTLLDRPYFEESYFYKGLALEALGQEEEASENLNLAVRFNPNYEAASAYIAELEKVR